MTSRHWTIVGIAALVVVLGVTAVNLAGVMGRLDAKTEELNKSLEVNALILNERDSVIEASDALIAEQDAIEEEVAEDLGAAEEDVEEATSETDQAMAAALELTEDYPVIRDALIAAQTELVEEREERAEEKSIAASALFASQMRNRTLSAQLLDERTVSSRTIAGLNATVAIAIERGDIAINALRPSFLTKIFDMPEVALVGAVIGGGLVYVAVR